MHAITITKHNQATCLCGWKGTVHKAGKIDGARGAAAIKEGQDHMDRVSK